MMKSMEEMVKIGYWLEGRYYLGEDGDDYLKVITAKTNYMEEW